MKLKKLEELKSSEGLQGKNLPLRSEVRDDTTMRDDKDFLSYKTYVYNFFNSSNFFNFP